MRIRPILLALPVLAAGAALIPAAPGGRTRAVAEDTADRARWPFGVAEGAGAFSKRDLYNLGPLGLKCRDADRAESSMGETSGVRKVAMDGDKRVPNDGPPRLRVEVLFPDGPAAKAGLLVGDVLVGASGKPFKEGSLAPIAAAITKAESGAAKGVVTLTVDRAGTPTRIEVVIPVLGKEWTAPHAGKAREAQIAQACKWLADRQGAEGGYAETLCGVTGAVTQTSVAGLCWLASGSDLSQGPYKEHLAKALAFVAAHADAQGTPSPSGGPNMDQSNWGWCHMAVFLGELCARPGATDDAKALLRRCGEELAKRQESSGGWAHGPGGPNGLGYVELNIVSALALQGMGMAQRAGFVPPPDVMKKAEEYIAASGSGDGGVGYSSKPGQAGIANIGRTAATWLGLASLGQKGGAWAKKAEKWVKTHAGEVFDGHASLMQHYLFGGVAAQAIGGDAPAKYWETCLRDLVLARAPDGSFQPRPFHESVAMGSNSDVSFGEVWTTAAWTLVLAAEPDKTSGRPGLPAWTGRLPAAAPGKPAGR
ncbi:MAG: hypothetical protein HMLKMBBP_02782 [Planctomycetes bacterium]|nr:hypothetical protein [Planctomycetota bacterium]